MKSWNEIRKNATAFSKRWKDAYDEKSQAQSFLKEFFAVFGVDIVLFNTFEHRVKFGDGSQGYADCFWPGKILVEMKSRGRDLNAVKKYPKLAPIVDTLFEGRIDQLVPYYRHLFLLVKTVAQADSKLFTYDEKRQFLRVLRAQLSSAEQTLLFFNWLSGHGKEWEEDASKSNGNHFFTDYRMIHNIIPEQQPFTKESILQSILSRNPHYRKLNDEDTLFELIDEKEA